MTSKDKKIIDKSDRKVVLNPNVLQRVLMLLAYAVALVLFIKFNLKMIHFVIFPMPFLFDSSSLLQSYWFEQHYLSNAFLYSLFFVQHTVMASFLYKQAVVSFVPSFYLYERYIYNIFSSWGYLLILDNVKPVSLESEIIFKMPAIICGVVTIAATIVLIISMLKLGGDVFNPFPLKRIIKGQSLNHPGYQGQSEQGLVSEGIYALCRHPMQGSVCLLLIFSGHIYTVDRLIFVSVHLIGIILGVTMQQIRLCKKFKRYPEYQQKVRYRLIPFIL